MIGYAEYAKIKDHYCICYFGYSDEYLVQIRLLKGVMEREFDGLNIYFGCKDDKTHLLEGCPKILKISEIKMNRRAFAHIRELRFNGEVHPVEELLVSSGIKNFAITTEARTPTTKCVIITSGNYPTKPLDQKQIQILEQTAKSEGFSPVIDGDCADAGWVIGVESIPLFEAAGRGIKTSLVPTGIGTRLYKLMFPSGDVLHT